MAAAAAAAPNHRGVLTYLSWKLVANCEPHSRSRPPVRGVVIVPVVDNVAVAGGRSKWVEVGLVLAVTVVVTGDV